MTEHIVITCHTCKVTWDMDFDPPQCDDDAHEYTIEVVK